MVFVHGFRSDPSVWDPLIKLIHTDAELGFVETSAFAYETTLWGLDPRRRVPSLAAIAGSLKEFVDTEAEGVRRLLLVGHSMGGLVIQRFLARMLSEGRGKDLARIQGVILLATPHHGSQLGLFLRRWFLPGNPQEAMLRPLVDEVAETQGIVMRNVVHAHDVTAGTCPIPFVVYAGETDNIVPLASAQSVFPDAAVLPGGHSDLVRPVDAADRRYRSLRRRIIEAAERDGSLPPRRPGIRVQSPCTGRTAELRVLSDLLHPDASCPPTVALTGMAGVGKSTLATHAAECARAEEWFTGGVLHLDMNGHSAAGPLDASTAAARLLRQIGDRDAGRPDTCAVERWHAALDERAGRAERLLVVLDDVRTVSQVGPLLPSVGSCHRILMTSRHKLGDLRSARLVEVHPLDGERGARLLRTSLALAHPGDGRADEAPGEFVRLAELCGGLPMALVVVAGILKSQRTLSPTQLAEELGNARTRLDVLSPEGTNEGGQELAVRAAFELSYTYLKSRQARLFRLVSLNPGPDLSVEAVAALAGAEPILALRGVRELADAHLVESRGMGGCRSEVGDA
ncbi:alpha/beta fold hydrolase [Streptomyces sp. NPDC093111]|uniref:alpha/beta fold hydrolase n=1 Tax=Streptomyces sp. NPDC093111 TaxID=3154978 RepID=UPI00341E1372